jgi:ADP-heptose:LPS heptosyltransferase
MMDRNYLEHQHELAGIPHRPQVHFYATEEEKRWARKIRAKMGAGPVIMYSLSGSSVHKTWAGMDSIIAGLMIHYPTAHVVLVGGPECVILEQGWENEPRVHKTSGKWSIRQSLSFLDQCHLVMGPETGVLNAVACVPVPKIVFLSHSTHENLTRDWLSVTPIWSKKTSCPKRPDGVPACHILHYSWEHCTKDEVTSTAQCQADIDSAEVWDAVEAALGKV